MVETLFDQVFQFPRCHLNNNSPAPPCIICEPRDLYTIGFRNYEICCHSTIKERGGEFGFQNMQFKNDPPPSPVFVVTCVGIPSPPFNFQPNFFYLIQSSDFGVFQVVV